MSVGKNVKKYREEIGLNQTELAEKVNISQAMIARIESGTKLPSVAILKNIADVLHCSMDEENAKRYKEYQTQRALERKIRESKRECMLLSEAGDTEGLKKAALTLRNRKENYSAYSKAHDLRVHNDRTQVYGYDRSKSMKTVWAEKKAQSGGSSAPAPSGGKAVTVNVPAPANTGKAYTGEKIVKPLENKIKAVEMPQAKTIEEAQAYAKKLGVEYPDYSKFTVERANNMNNALSTLPDDSAPYVVTDLQKYTAVTGAPLDKRAKNGYACTVTPYEIDLKRAKIADAPRISGSGDIVVAVNTKTYKTLDSITESKARSEELVVSRNLGKAYHFNTDGKATDFHECGHVYASKHGLPMAFSADADRWYRETGCELLKSPSEAWAEAYAAYYTHADDLPSYIRRYFDDGEWKTGSGSKVLTLDEWYKKLLDNDGRSGIMNTTTNAVGKTVQIYNGHSNSLTGPPNGIVQRVGKKGGIDRNYYDKNGNQIKQVSNNGHGNKSDEKLGEHGEHAHDYLYNGNGELVKRSRGRELNDEERKENADIL